MVKVKEDMTGWIMSEHGVEDSRLIVIEQTDDYIDKNGKHQARYLCKCNCGNNKNIIAFPRDIKCGSTKSCGCLNIEKQRDRLKKCNEYNVDGEYGIGYCSNTKTPFYFDLEDYELINDYCWLEVIDQKTGYKELKTTLIIDGAKKQIHMHQLLGYNGGDHIDRNPMNNRRKNIRHASVSENNRNRGIFRNNTSGIIGVYFEKRTSKWHARIMYNKERIHLGRYSNKDDAIRARLAGELKYFGSEFAPQRHLFQEYGIFKDSFENTT